MIFQSGYTSSLAISICIALSLCGLSNDALSKPATVIFSAKLGPSPSNRKFAIVERGKSLFRANQCLDCHSLDHKGNNDGVSLTGIGQRRTTQFLKEHLRDPEAHVAHHAKEFDGDPNMMTPPGLTESEINAVVAYLKSLPLPKKKAP